MLAVASACWPRVGSVRTFIDILRRLSKVLGRQITTPIPLLLRRPGGPTITPLRVKSDSKHLPLTGRGAPPRSSPLRVRAKCPQKSASSPFHVASWTTTLACLFLSRPSHASGKQNGRTVAPKCSSHGSLHAAGDPGRQRGGLCKLCTSELVLWEQGACSCAFRLSGSGENGWTCVPVLRTNRRAHRCDFACCAHTTHVASAGQRPFELRWWPERLLRRQLRQPQLILPPAAAAAAAGPARQAAAVRVQSGGGEQAHVELQGRVVPQAQRQVAGAHQAGHEGGASRAALRPFPS